MRTRLVVVFFVPLSIVLLILCGAYAWESARSIQQSFYTQQLSDLSYFVTSGRQALHSGSTTVVAEEATRFQQLFDRQVVVVDARGAVVAHGGEEPVVLGPEDHAQLALALSGRRGDPPRPMMPWAMGDMVLVEPVFDGGDVIGAVMISTSAESPRFRILALWAVLAVVAISAILLGLLIVVRLAHWVLQPVRRLDRAMVAMEQGDMEARIDADTGPPELRRMTRLFNQMADKIERSIMREREFAQNASHELRNPLAALLVRVESLATGLDESWDEDVEATREEGRRMTRILDALLSVARSGHGSVEPVVVDLADLVRRRVDAWQEVSTGRGVRLVVDTQEGVLSLTDPSMVESALDTVIDNAVKFSPPGSQVVVSAAQSPSEEEHCVLHVRDNGPGMTEEELEHATERFWRSPRDRSKPGSGLGLAISAELLASLGGALRLSAPSGGGLCVELSLPGREGS